MDQYGEGKSRLLLKRPRNAFGNDTMKKLLDDVSRHYPQSKAFISLTLILITVILCVVLQRGINVGPDSLTYLKTANVFFTDEHPQASVQFPPLYALLIKLVSAFSLDFSQSAKLLNVMFFLVSTFLCGSLLHATEIAGKRKSILIAILLMSSYVVFVAHTQMMTEALFIVLVFANLRVLVAYCDTQSTSLLFLASTLASLSALSRYAGIAIMMSTLVIALVYTPERSIKGWLRISLIWGLSSIPFGLWLTRNMVLYNTFTGREITTHAREFESGWNYLEKFSQLYFPTSVPETLRTLIFSILIIALLAMLISVYKRNKVDSEPQTAFKLVLFIVGVAMMTQVMLLVIALYVDPFLPIQQRILTPIYSLFLLLHFLLLLHVFTQPLKGLILVGYCAAFLILNLVRITGNELKVKDLRFGYGSSEYANSELISHWDNEDFKNTPLISNGDDAMNYHMQREILALPKLFNPRTNRSNDNFEQVLHSSYCQLQRNGGYLVYFTIIDWRDYLPSLALLKSRYPFEVVKHTNDGEVLRPAAAHESSICS